jgi:hypothetical protein
MVEPLEDRTVPSSLGFSTFLGGSSSDSGTRVAIDASGNIFLAGETQSADFPVTPGAFDTSYHGNQDGFVAKFNPSGALLWATYLGGSGEEGIRDIAVDTADNVYVTGYTRSHDFPTTANAFQPIYASGGADAFVAKLNPSGTALLYSTFLGHDDEANGIALDAAGNAYVTGLTASADFPTVNALQARPLFNGNNPFVAKLNATGSALIYSTYLGGSNQGGSGYGIAVDAAGNAYVAGSDNATDFPTTPGAFQTTNHGGGDAFVSKLNPSGSALVYSTYVGGSGDDAAHAIAVDGSGNAYVTGLSRSADFPTVNPFQTTNRGGPSNEDAFVFKLNSSGSALVYSTYLGGSGDDETESIAVDGTGNAYVAGQTQSPDFPTANALQPTYGGGSYDGFVTKLNPSGTGLVYSTFLGGSSYDAVFGIALDPFGNAYVSGVTESANFPTANAFQPVLSGPQDAFVAKIVQSATPAVTLTAANATYTGSAYDTANLTATVSPASASGSVSYVFYSGAAGQNQLPTPVNAGTYYVQAFFTSSSSDFTDAQSGIVPFSITAKTLTVDASTQGTLNIAKAGTISFALQVTGGLIGTNNNVAALFNGTTFTIAVGGTSYSLTSTATVDSDGTINLSMQMSQGLQNALLTALSEGSTVDFSLAALSNDGNYSIAADAISRLISEGKLKFAVV